MNLYKLAITFLALSYCLYYASSPDRWHFIDNVDLIIHEAGHVVFMFFGEFMTIFGGSLLQILIPFIFFVYFYLKEQNFSASLLLYWLGINFINVSVYAGDSLKMQLPLITGVTETHDWNQLLFRLGLLRHTDGVSEFIYYLGISAIVIGFAYGFYILYQNRDRVVISD